MANKLTVTQVNSLLKKATPGRYSAGNGLYLRISNEGTGFWVVRYTVHEKRREITLGKHPELSLVDANAETALIKKDVKNNIDPLAERQRGHTLVFSTVDDLAEDWLKDCDKRLKHSRIPRRSYKKDIAPIIGGLALDQVNPRDIRFIINKISDSGRPTTSNDALMYCKQLFRHGIKLDLIVTNPAEAFRVGDAGGVEKSRIRVLTVEEIESVFFSFRQNSDQFVRENFLAAALLVVLGVRKGELIASQWTEFELDADIPVWNIPKERSKTGVSISVPLPDAAVKWFEELKVRAFGSKFVFPNRRASKRFGHVSPDTLNAAIGKLFREDKLLVDHFTIHDFRRTCRSLMASEGVPGHVAERCLNHKLKGVEGIYDRYDYFDERYQALSKIAARLEPIINQEQV
jgi:integrase